MKIRKTMDYPIVSWGVQIYRSRSWNRGKDVGEENRVLVDGEQGRCRSAFESDATILVMEDKGQLNRSTSLTKNNSKWHLH